MKKCMTSALFWPSANCLPWRSASKYGKPISPTFWDRIAPFALPKKLQGEFDMTKRGYPKLNLSYIPREEKTWQTGKVLMDVPRRKRVASICSLPTSFLSWQSTRRVGPPSTKSKIRDLHSGRALWFSSVAFWLLQFLGAVLLGFVTRSVPCFSFSVIRVSAGSHPWPLLAHQAHGRRPWAFSRAKKTGLPDSGSPVHQAYSGSRPSLR
jgi:hypothetical protein